MDEIENSVTIEQLDDVSLIVLNGSFDITHTLQLDHALRSLVQKGAKKLLLDLSNATYLVSTGFRAIINSQVRLNLVDGQLHVVSPPLSAVRRTFQLTRLDQIVHLFDDRDTAIRAFT